MPKLPQLSGKECVKALKKLGFEELRQKGSHVILKKETHEGSLGCVVPMHKEIAKGTLNSILKQAKIEPEELIRIL